jgi:hypothetical protein
LLSILNHSFCYQICINYKTLFFFIVVLDGSTLWHLQKFLQCIKYIILNSRPPPLSFIPLSPPFLEWFQQVSFLHLHTCIYIFCTVFTLLSPFPIISPLLLIPTPCPPGRTCSTFLFSNFVEEKREKLTFLLV